MTCSTASFEAGGTSLRVDVDPKGVRRFFFDTQPFSSLFRALHCLVTSVALLTAAASELFICVFLRLNSAFTKRLASHVTHRGLSLCSFFSFFMGSENLIEQKYTLTMDVEVHHFLFFMVLSCVI